MPFENATEVSCIAEAGFIGHLSNGKSASQQHFTRGQQPDAAPKCSR
jgi:hypothetical protein